MTILSPFGGARAAQVFDSSKRPPAAIEELEDLYQFRDLVWQWSARNPKLLYKRTVLGVV